MRLIAIEMRVRTTFFGIPVEIDAAAPEDKIVMSPKILSQIELDYFARYGKVVSVVSATKPCE